MDRKALLLDQLRIERGPAGVEKKGRWTKRAALLAAVGIVTVALVAAASMWISSEVFAVPVKAVVVRAAPSGTTGAVSAGNLLDASGYVVALRQATVSAKSIYKVNEIRVQQGDQVKEGQVIARLDDSNIRAMLEQSLMQAKQSQAELAAAKLALADARPTFERNRQQVVEGLISQDAFDGAKASFDAAQAAVDVAQSNLAVAKAAVEVNRRLEDDTDIRAPFDGVVTAKNAQPGEIVSPQFQGGGGLVLIVDMSSLEVDVDVNENYISRVRAHQPATITLDAYPDWQIPAEVIAIIPTADRSKATVQVRVGFLKRDAHILPQMGARVSFLGDDPPVGLASRLEPPAVIVPTTALEVSRDGARVFVIENQIVEGRTVRLGARTGADQFVLSGLQPGTTIAVGDLSKLRNGTRVRFVK